jgi:hypothetical protein
MAKINRWWAGDPRENLWLEVTRRDDIGANLKAPQANERGEDYWSYSLIHEIQEGDVIYHYDGVAQAITARSVATGIVWTQDVVWAARGSSARSANITPHSRPGWYLGLEDFDRLPVPITLDSIRNRADANWRILKYVWINWNGPRKHRRRIGRVGRSSDEDQVFNLETHRAIRSKLEGAGNHGSPAGLYRDIGRGLRRAASRDDQSAGCSTMLLSRETGAWAKARRFRGVRNGPAPHYR